MVETPRQRILTGRQIQLAALVVAFSFVISGILGVIRQAVIGASFGAGLELDAFYAAYRVPEMLFTLVAGGALGSAFIPVFGRLLNAEDLDGAWKLASTVITLVALAAILLAILAAIFSFSIVSNILLPGASMDEKILTAELMRIMLASVVIFGISGILMGILNSHQRFFAPAIAPSMNNVGLIIGAIVFVPKLGVYGLAIGAILGALLHLSVQLPILHSIKPRLRPSIAWRASGAGEVLKLMAPRVLGSAVVQINFVVNAALASSMIPGSLTALTVAFSLMFTVLGVLGQSVGTAVFPTLSLLEVQNDRVGFQRTLAGALRNVLFTSIPATIGMIVLANPLVATIYQHNRWTAADTTAAAWALQFFALGLSAFALQEVLARAFFALRDTSTPVMIGIGGMLINVVLSLLLIRVVHGQPILFGPPTNPLNTLQLWAIPAGQGPFGGLALANSLATALESVALWLLIRRRVGSLNDRAIIGAALRGLLVSLIMGAVVWGVARVLNNRSPLLILLIGTITGMIAFEAAALALGLPEARSIPIALLRRFKRRQAAQT